MGVLEDLIKKGETTHVFILPNEKRIELDLVDIENIFKGYRPRNLLADDFKAVSKIIKKEVAQYLKGKLVHLSKVSPEFWKQHFEKGLVNTHKQRGYTYVKKSTDDKRKGS